MRLIMIAAALVLGLAACEPVNTPVSAPAATPALQPTIDQVLARAGADIGRDVGGGMTLVSASNQGDTLIFGFRYILDGTTINAIGRDAFVTAFVDEFGQGSCESPNIRNFVAQGGRIRIDVRSDDGQPLISSTLNAC